MKGMGSWEADAPGEYGPWWKSRKKYCPPSASQAFDDFITALNQHNASESQDSLHQLSAAGKVLIKALQASGSGPKVTVRNRLAHAFAPSLRSSKVAKSPIDNLITAVTNVVQSFGGAIVPDQYEV
jgi:hypothetical protein